MSTASDADHELVALLDAARDGSRRALARLITLVERGGDVAHAVDTLTFPRGGRARVVGITGAPGVGKSTLTGRLAATLADRGFVVAVLAVDPSSPLTGGAILGDRVRMHTASVSRSVFIRSLATRGATGGLSFAIPGAIRVLDAAGFDAVLVETVGVGQSEIAIAAAAESTVVVVAPGWGDAIQANKAGLLELGDVFVVNKADQPRAADAVRDLERMLDLGAHHAARDDAPRPSVVCTTATSGEGVDGLARVLDEHHRHLRESGERDARRAAAVVAETRARALAVLAARLDQVIATESGEAAFRDVRDRLAPPWVAANRLVELVDGREIASRSRNIP